MEGYLREKWNTLTTSTVPSASTTVINKWYDHLSLHYSSPIRHYHTQHHIHDLLSLCDLFLINSPVISYAICVVYEPTRSDNEAESALLFHKFATEVALSQEIDSTVQHFINCTKNHTEVSVGDKELDYFLDFDLSVLGKEPGDYDKYAQQIRQEYIHYPDEDYRKGRARVLEKFLSIPILFRTEDCKNRFLEPAKKNLQRELATLV